MTSKDPPEDLNAASKSLWRKIISRKENLSSGRRELIAEAFRCKERLEQVRAELNKSTLTLTTEKSGAVHLNPLAKLETELRRQLSSMWQSLQLHWEMRIDGRGIPIVEDDDETEEA